MFFNKGHLQLVVLLTLSLCIHTMAQSTKIGFLVWRLSFRGTEVAIYNYADCNEAILGNESIILNFDINNHNEVRTKFVNRFGSKFYDCSSLEAMDKIIEKENIAILHNIKAGEETKRISKVCKNAVHVVFKNPPQKIHGEVYACNSQWLSEQYRPYNIPWVPRMIRLTKTEGNLRKDLSIPADALVFGRHGGNDSFSIPFVHKTITKFASENPHIYFLFLNTDQFCILPNVIYLPRTADVNYKTKFINSCDAMIHARLRGETFGIACGEFSIKNKPVITWKHSIESSHIQILGDKGIYYSNEQDLYNTLKTFKKKPYKNWDAYTSKFNPETVMKKFNDVFIKPLMK